LRERVRRAGLFDVFVDIVSRGVSKVNRIASLTPFVETGNFMVHNNAGGKDRLLYEMSRCRRGGGLPEHDDIVDATAMILDIRRQYGIPAGSEAEKDEEKFRGLDSRSRTAWEGVRHKDKELEGVGEFL